MTLVVRKQKNLCHRVKVVERFPYILSNSNENIQILKIFFSCSFDEFSCKVDSKEGCVSKGSLSKGAA